MADPFRMKCPKCGTTNYSVERDTRAYSMGDDFNLIFSCSCGKQLFGAQVLEEHDRQLAAFQAKTTHSRPAPVPASAAASSDASDVEKCEWEPCSNPRRPRSKYCSRACSNKNARARFKQRKNGARPGVITEAA